MSVNIQSHLYNLYGAWLALQYPVIATSCTFASPEQQAAQNLHKHLSQAVADISTHNPSHTCSA
jgi:hypothetical protein